MKNLKKPKEIIAKALDCDINSVSNESGISKHPSWDSFGQLSIIVELEESYGIKINDDDILKYSNIKTITELYNSLLNNEQ
jgi:acyl carrier protein